MQMSPDQLLTCTVHDKSGHKVGKVQQVYLDDATGAPSWVTVRTGIFGTNESLVPVEQAELNGNLLQVPFDRQVIHDAPNFDPGHHLDESDEDELHRYYGMSPPASTPRTTSQGQDRGEQGQQGQVGGERAHEDPDRGERALEDQIGGEPVQQPPAHSNRASRGEDQQVSPARASGEYVSGSASSGERENRDEHRRPDNSHSGRPDTDTPGTGSRDSERPDSERPDSERPDSERPDSERSDPGQERELLQRERDLLQRERDLLDREREVAEQEGSVRPRLRRHDPGNRS